MTTTASRHRRLMLTALLLVLALVLAACSDGDAEPTDTTTEPAETQPDTTDAAMEPDEEEPPASEDDDEVVANLHLPAAPRAWSPFIPGQGQDTMVMYMIFQTLFVPTPDGTLAPRLAESWDISDDGRTFTFHLYEGMEWNDGTPLTSSDVKLSYELQANPDITPQATQWEPVLGWDDFTEGQADELVGLQAPDDTTFVIELAEPHLGFLTQLILMRPFVLPAHVLDEIPPGELEDHPYFLEPTVGYGPYNFVRYEVDQFIEMEANPDYHLGAPEIDRIFIWPLTSDVAAAQLGTGEIDVAQISATDVDIVDGFDNATVRPALDPGYLRLSFKTLHEESPHGQVPQERWQDPRVRQAMLYALDRQGIVDTVFDGYAEVVNTGFHTEWAVPDDLNDYPYDPERARELLDEAGWDSSEPIVLAWTGGNRDRDATMTIIQQQWGAVGIEVDLVPHEAGQGPDPVDVDMGIVGGGFFTVEPNAYPQHHCGSGRNQSFYCNPELDDLWQLADRTTDPDERAELYQQIARTLNEEIPVVYLVREPRLWATNDRLQGFVPDGFFGTQFAQVHEWWIED